MRFGLSGGGAELQHQRLAQTRSGAEARGGHGRRELSPGRGRSPPPPAR